MLVLYALKLPFGPDVMHFLSSSVSARSCSTRERVPELSIGINGVPGGKLARRALCQFFELRWSGCGKVTLVR